SVRGAAIDPYAVIGARTQVAPGAVVGAHATVGADCVIGRGSVLEPGARLHARTRIGANCRIASGAVIGASGFGYAEGARGAWTRIEQLGGVVIGNEVDIGANTTIDRGALDDTVIGDGVKLDNQIQIAHNVRVGDHTIMAGCVAIAGSAVIGKRCRLGGRAAVLGHLRIADDVTILADGFVAASIAEPGEYASMLPAQAAAQHRRTIANLRRLDSLAKKVAALAAKIEAPK
ncbi:MAG: UDP-3-O-(3-hydroxymyristoyl)glucosamine N-acyltransferase, partial [bacterium]